MEDTVTPARAESWNSLGLRGKVKRISHREMQYTREEHYSLMFPLGSLRNSEMHHKKGGQLELSTQFRKHQLKITTARGDPPPTDTGVSQVRSFVPMSTHSPQFYNVSAYWVGESKTGKDKKKICFWKRNLPHCKSFCCRALVCERGGGLTLDAIQNSHNNTGHFDFCEF